jgi:hypothetical protein
MKDNKGAALVLAIMAVACVAALALSLSMLTDVEMRVAANYSDAHEAMSAAEAALEFAVRETLSIADWSGVAAGNIRSTFTDGGPGGSRTRADGSSLDLTALTTNLGDPGWRLFAHGALNRLENVPSNAYVVVWAKPDPVRPQEGLALRADAFGSTGTRRGVQATVSRRGVLSWKEVR